ncbi:TraR/DksA family transcriptional regulator [Amphibacillus indicireducens]|uniref:YteA family sporulation protein n=1 Tax=Amphibacillus indicireducens TaxID=1076330 RepID=A0ABP7VN80_9BACI
MLKDKDLNKLRRDLESRAIILNKKIERDKQRATEEEYSTELSDYDNHPGDQGTELFEREKDLAISAHEVAELKMINHALERIQNDQYGRCETCGEEIDLERLKARPESNHCIAHAKSLKYFNEEMDYSMSSLEMDDTDSWSTLEGYGSSESPSDFSSDHDDYNQLTEKREEDEGMDQYSAQDDIKNI